MKESARTAGCAGLRALAILALSTLATAAVSGCSPSKDESAATPLPTRQTTIDPVIQKLDAAQQEAERRRAEIESASK
jgi:hypothetical protein